MQRRSRRPAKEEYGFLTVRVDTYALSVDFGIHYEARDMKRRDHATRVFSWGSHIELAGEGRCSDGNSNGRYTLVDSSPSTPQTPVSLALQRAKRACSRSEYIRNSGAAMARA
jgi:hypothetical protein